MSVSTIYLLDSDVFIAAKNAYYAFDICPGFWKGILQTHQRGKIQSIDRIRGELLSGRKGENLVEWVRNDVPASFFSDSNDDDVSSAYTEVMLWVQRSSQFFDRAKAKFATEADGWLVAYSMVNGTVVVRKLIPSPEPSLSEPPPAGPRRGEGIGDRYFLCTTARCKTQFRPHRSKIFACTRVDY